MQQRSPNLKHSVGILLEGSEKQSVQDSNCTSGRRTGYFDDILANWTQ